MESAKNKIHEQEKLVQDLQSQIHNMKRGGSAKNSEIADKLEELKAQSELLEIERKVFEDLEFQQLESQAHDEELKEELAQEVECFKETIAQRQVSLKFILVFQKNNKHFLSFIHILFLKVKCLNEIVLYLFNIFFIIFIKEK